MPSNSQPLRKLARQRLADTQDGAYQDFLFTSAAVQGFVQYPPEVLEPWMADGLRLLARLLNQKADTVDHAAAGGTLGRRLRHDRNAHRTHLEVVSCRE